MVMSRLAKDVAETAFKAGKGDYGKIIYRKDNSGNLDTWENNVMKWDGKNWHSDCLGFVHTMVNGFDDTKVLGGGATLDNFVLNADEKTTLLNYCEMQSNDFSSIIIGEHLDMNNSHVGIYVGEHVVNGFTYNVAECTMGFKKGGVISYVDSKGNRFNHKGGTQSGKWTTHARYKRLDYSTPKTYLPIDILDVCKKVCLGVYGVNPARKEKLTKEFGSALAVKIQNIVDLLYR